MQILGNNLRKTGDCFGSKKNKTEDMESHELTVVRRIDLLISCIVNLEDQSRICIDALRCPAEILFFRDKYRAFYAMAVSTEVEERQNRLGMTLKQLINFDDVENPKGVDGFFHQNIAACMEIADIYLYNPTVNNGKYYELTEQIIKYIALMLHPGLIAPTHIERCMQLAFNAKYNSGCLSRQVGAILTGADFSVRSVGWNDVPKGQIPCNLRCVEDFCQNKDMETFSEYELNDSDFNEAMNCINTKLCGGENKEEKKYHERVVGVVAMHIVLKMYIMP
jgi:deoxycytidylate deaminase